VNNCKREYIEYFLILFFIIGTCIPLINAIILLYKERQIFFPVNELTGYIGYYIAGYYFVHYKLMKIKICIYIFSIFSILFTIIGTSLEAHLKQVAIGTLYNYLLPNTMFVAYGVFLLFRQVFEKMKFSEKKRRIILKISKNTFGIYLVHALVIERINAFGINTLTINPILSIPILSMLVMIISYVITRIIGKIPVLNKYVI